jgi:hypothetical protein
VCAPIRTAGARPLHGVVICVPGHQCGVDDIVGIDSEGRERVGKAGWQPAGAGLKTGRKPGGSPHQAARREDLPGLSRWWSSG